MYSMGGGGGGWDVRCVMMVVAQDEWTKKGKGVDSHSGGNTRTHTQHNNTTQHGHTDCDVMCMCAYMCIVHHACCPHAAAGDSLTHPPTPHPHTYTNCVCAWVVWACVCVCGALSPDPCKPVICVGFLLLPFFSVIIPH
eukprot:TRINITY_DN67321_c7_g1_i1.p1 TRINITY_DN67321_c7_g1~~TRINITY_DN67321_c7_g1_i1.p1  ORF type:complete len:139 (-),score=2.41 TRINITY_DN67321_c7_g1_i1:174-590(-)